MKPRFVVLWILNEIVTPELEFRMSNDDNMTQYGCADAETRPSIAGLTIIELLVVVAIISMMSGIGLFYINSENFRLQSEVRNLRSIIAHARVESIRYNKNVMVTVYSDRYEYEGDSVKRVVYFNDFMILKSDFSNLGSDARRVNFTPDGRAYFGLPGFFHGAFHVVIGNSSQTYYSICVNFAGRIWIMPNDPVSKKSCTN